MPILLSFSNPETGVVCAQSYWVIDSIAFHPRDFTSKVVLAGYFDQAAYNDITKRPFLTEEFAIVQNPLVTNITVADAIAGVYVYALAMIPLFAGGTIV